MSFQEHIPYFELYICISSSTLLHIPKSIQCEKSPKYDYVLTTCYISNSVGLIWVQWTFSCIWNSERSQGYVKPTDKRDLTICNLMGLSDLYPQVLQKLGKNVETKDERFEQSANNFYHQQVIWRAGKGSLEGWVVEEQHVLEIRKHS